MIRGVGSRELRRHSQTYLVFIAALVNGNFNRIERHPLDLRVASSRRIGRQAGCPTDFFFSREIRQRDRRRTASEPKRQHRRKRSCFMRQSFVAEVP